MGDTEGLILLLQVLSLTSQHEGARLIVGRAYPKKKKMGVAGHFAAVKHRSETYSWTKKLNREGYGVDKYWVLSFVFAG
jgi:hypothetical protein